MKCDMQTALPIFETFCLSSLSIVPVTFETSALHAAVTSWSFLLHLWLTLRQIERFNTLPIFTKKLGHRMTELFENSYIEEYHHHRNYATTQRALLHIMYSDVLNTCSSQTHMFKSYGNRFVGTETTVQIKNFNDTFTSNATFSKNNYLSNFISWILLYVFKHNYICKACFLIITAVLLFSFRNC